MGRVFDLQRFCVHDGPGIRTSVFFKGCPLRCRWCHNPEGLAFEPEIKESGPPCLNCGLCRQACDHEDCRPFDRCLHICPQGRLKKAGERVEAAALAERIKVQADFLLANGGVTLSGGEPLAQPDFLIDLMRSLQPLHLALETSGQAPLPVFQAACGLADLVMVDIKHMDAAEHRRWTGADNRRILANIAWLKAQAIPFIVRVPLIPGVNDGADNLAATAAFLAGAPALSHVELLPYNTLAGSKYASVGRTYDPGFDESRPPNIDCAPFAARGIRCQVL